jgi:hypothetical protein
MGHRSFGAVGEVRAFVGAAGRVAAWKGALVGLGRGGVRLGARLALREVLGEAVNAVRSLSITGVTEGKEKRLDDV